MVVTDLMQDMRATRKEKWDRRMLKLCEEVASWSKDPSTQVGAIITRPDNTIVTTGYNGFPRGFPDNPEDYANREKKYQFIVHAEANAIATAREDLTGYTLYTWPLPTCADCAKLAIQAGIKRFVSVRPTNEQSKRWEASFYAAETLLLECRADQTLYSPPPAATVVDKPYLPDFRDHDVEIVYRNHEGKTAVRKVTPIEWFYGSTYWHREDQWFMRAYCHTKGAERSFAVKDILGWYPVVK